MFFALLLLLPAGPISAQTSTDARSEAVWTVPSFRLEPAAARPTSGLELFQRLEVRLLDPGESPGKLPPPRHPSSAASATAGREILPAAFGLVPPLPEVIPYDATAPPLGALISQI